MRIFVSPWLPFGWDGLALKWVILYKRGHQDIIPHEWIHINQQRKLGLGVYLWRYFFNPDFRYTVEFEAYRFGSRMNYYDAISAAMKYL